MTRVRSNPAKREASPALGVRTGSVVWTVERRAMLAAQPELPFDRRSRRPIELRIRFDESGRLGAELVDPQAGVRTPIELASPRVTFVDAGPYTHVEIASGAECVLGATLKREDAGTRLLYARTGLLARLGVKGGRYPAPAFEA